MLLQPITQKRTQKHFLIHFPLNSGKSVVEFNYEKNIVPERFRSFAQG